MRALDVLSCSPMILTHPLAHTETSAMLYGTSQKSSPAQTTALAFADKAMPLYGNAAHSKTVRKTAFPRDDRFVV